MSEKTTNGRAGNGFAPIMPPFGLETLMELNRPALAAMAEVNGKVYENLAAMNMSWAAFVNRRLKEDFDMPKQLAACKTVQEMYGVYAGFFQNAITDYQAEFEHISKLGKAVAEETAHAMQTRLDEAAKTARTQN